MSGSEWLAILALLACALAILPGTLGILMLTNRLAAEAGGARLIYQHSRLVFVLSLVALAVAWLLAARNQSASAVIVSSTIAYAAILAFGFLMHTRLMFRPVRDPTFIPVEQALQKFDAAEEVVGVIDPAGEPYAFIARLARRPHIVHQPHGNAPFMMTHCILSHSSMAYENSGEFKDPEIMITAAVANNMVFYEVKNRCSITQLHNASRDGSLPLKTLPSLMMSLSTWATLYPDSPVWVRPRTWRDAFYLKVLSRADVIDPASPVLVYPLMNEPDGRLPLKSLVLGVEINGAERAYPLELLDSDTLINDELGSTPLLIVSAYGGDYAQVFSRNVQARNVLTFRSSGVSEQLIDNETESIWDIKGNCVQGAHEGNKLQQIPHYNKIFWFAWVDYHPGTEVYASVDAGSHRGRAA